MIRVQPLLVILFLALAAPLVFGQEKGFSVEAKPQEVLEAQAGIGERYALLIGISKYANTTINLNFADNDARALNDLLLDPEIGAYKPENVRLLVNEEATRRNIMSSLNTWLGNRVRQEDSVLIFYSGHGALGNGSEAYWVTHDADVEDLYASALSNRDISDLIAKLPAKRKLTLIDSCYSEATAKKYRALVPSDIFEEFTGEGVVTITASTGQEKSVEVGGHGAFTYHLLEALEGKGDANGNGVVELGEMWNYLSDKVQKTAADAGNRQTPVLLADRLEHGFPLTINPARAAGATLNRLKEMYSAGNITVEEIGEAEQLLTTRGADPELRKLYQDLAAGVLTPDYFRRMREIHRPAAPAIASSTPVQPATPDVGGAFEPPMASESPLTETIASTGTIGAYEETEAYRASELVDSAGGWERFLSQYPNSVLAGSARARLTEIQAQELAETMAYDIAKASDIEAGWRQYLSRFPNGNYVSEARGRLQQLQENRQHQEREPAAYIVAESQNTEEGWVNFVREFPNSQLAMVAQRRLDELRKANRENENSLYAKALEIDTPALWDQYIQEYSDGRFLSEAMEKRTASVRRVEEETVYQESASLDTRESWMAYLDKFPEGRNVGTARTRIQQITWAEFADVAPIAGGSFMMGNSRDKGDAKPPHQVELEPFHISRTEVTNAQFSKFMEETGRRAPAQPNFAKNYMNTHPDLPVVNVTYADAEAYSKWLTEKIGTTVRLPTEAEWEYAAGGGQANILYPWGAGDPKTQARYNGNDPSGVKTVKEETFAPNKFGLYNMAGNVAEWVSDYYSDKYYRTSPARMPTGPASGKERVVRGGSWDKGKDELRVARRAKREPFKPDHTIGFRVLIEGLPQ